MGVTFSDLRPDGRRAAAFAAVRALQIALRLPRFVVTITRSRSPTLFRKAFHIKGNDKLRWVTQTHGFQVFQTTS